MTAVVSKQFQYGIRRLAGRPALPVARLVALLVVASGVAATTASPVSCQMRRLELRGIVVDTIAVIDLDFAMPTGFATGPDGSLLVADAGLVEIMRIDTTGRMIWRRGREGRGPGEFGMPYRVGFDGREIHVLDISNHEISRFTPDGRFVSRYRLPFYFSQVDAIVPLPDGRLAISGVAPPHISQRAIHVFDPQHEFVRSFGLLPPARDPRKGRGWGAGALVLDGQTLMFTRRLPYELSRFDVAGNEIERVIVPFQFRFEVDDYYEIRERGSTIQYTTLRTTREAPVNAFPLRDGAIVATRIDQGGRYLDLISADRSSVASWRMPADWRGIVAVFPDGERFWVVAESEMESVILALRVRGLVNP